ncbi:hypothetical protein ABPG72_005309 [Tetrahymena utriculariae]
MLQKLLEEIEKVCERERDFDCILYQKLQEISQKLVFLFHSFCVFNCGDFSSNFKINYLFSLTVLSTFTFRKQLENLIKVCCILYQKALLSLAQIKADSIILE